MSDPERIWLQSYEDTTAVGEDRLWCEEKVWPANDEDHEPTEYVLASRISQQDAELERVRRELADMTISRDGYAKQAMAREAEGRRKAFIEAAEIAEETAQGSDHLLKAASHAKDIQGALVHGEGVMTARIIAAALRAKAEGRP